MKKYILLLITVSFLFSCNGKQKDNAKDSKNNVKNKTKVVKNITITAVGDIMLGSNYPSPSLLPSGDSNILRNVSSILKDSDLTFGNLEGTLFDNGGSPKSCGNPSACYVFRMPSKYGKYLSDAGFDFMSIGNNHNGDFGLEGRIQTMKNLDSLNIKYAGVKDKAEYAFIEKDGIKYGFVAFAPNLGTVNINDIEYAKSLIKKVKSQSDVLIVSFHGGAEGNQHQHVTKKNEVFYGENRSNVYEFAHIAIDSGADIIFGQGPHVTRAIELYKNKFISYSAGNFATFGKFNLSGPSGIAPIFKITINSNGDFQEGKIIATYQTKGGLGPKIDPNKSVIQKIIELNAADFKEGNGLVVSNDGIIKRK